MMKKISRRPISGGTNNGARLGRYHYWRTGYCAEPPSGVDFYIAQVGEFHAKPNYVAGDFEHTEQTQVFYHLDGDATFTHNESCLTVKAGNLLIIPPHTPFSYSSNQGAKHHWMALEGAWPGVFGDQKTHVWRLNYDAEIEAIFAQMREILILRKPGYVLRVIGVFFKLMARIEEISGPKTSPESNYPEAVRNALIFLRENYDARFDAAQTAAMVGLSQPHLRALFRKWLGESPRQYHTRCRIEQAKRLLNEQKLPVAEVAFHTGFADTAHFSNVFKQITGLTPSHFRDS